MDNQTDCVCPRFDRQTLNAGAGSWTNSMDWHCPVHGKQHRDYEKPEGWGGDWTPQQKHEWSQSIKHAMNKQNDLPRQTCSCEKCIIQSSTAVSNKQNEHTVEPKLELVEQNAAKIIMRQIRGDENATDVSWESQIVSLVGEASMCWEPIPAGVFDSTEAMQIAFKIVKIANEQIENARQIRASGRVMYMAGRREVIGEVREIINNENDKWEPLNSPPAHSALRALLNIAEALTNLEALSNK